jgi:hypothetical protein
LRKLSDPAPANALRNASAPAALPPEAFTGGYDSVGRPLRRIGDGEPPGSNGLAHYSAFHSYYPWPRR